MSEPPLGRFTTHLKEALQKGLAFCIGSGRLVVEPGDLLVGLLEEQGSIAAEILKKSHITLEKAVETFRGIPGDQPPGSPIAPDLSLGVKKLLEQCLLNAHLLEHKYVGTEHLLSAILEAAMPELIAFFDAQGMNIAAARTEVQQILKSTSKFPDLSLHPDLDHRLPDADEEEAVPVPANGAPLPRLREKRQRALDAFARDLTAPQTIAGLDPVIGRDLETDRLIEVLCRRMKNNPVLLGEPGVGKTAIVEGLAQRIAAGNVPDILQGKRVLTIDMARVVAGTIYRGEFEARLKQIVDEAKADKDLILFIDEMHTLIGAGSASGTLDAANILKPALARGELRCIGATTWAEYKKHIEPDAALDRRYQPIDVQEPSATNTLAMLQGLKARYEEHHAVRYENRALEVAVSLAERYLTDRFFPDKAIDLLDEAGARANAKRRSPEYIDRLREMDKTLQAIRSEKEKAVKDGKLTDASKSLEQEEKIFAEKENLEKELAENRLKDRKIVTPQHVAEVVARMAQVPLSLIVMEVREHLSGLEERLNDVIVGQAAAIKQVAETVQRARLGLSDPKRPRGSFLFVGPSGVGKTELARTLAKEIFGREDALIKIDMSEFAEGHSVSKLLGSPAGYVGYRENNLLAETIRKNPHAVLLFDEFEKAHSDVQHLLLQALEEGKFRDSTGKAIHLRHAYIVLTSNVGSDTVCRTSLGFDQSGLTSGAAYDGLVREQLKERFRPELLNRLDRVIVFQPLERQNLKTIIRREVDVILERLSLAQNVSYKLDNTVIDWLLNRDAKIEEGARSAKRIVEAEMTSLLSRSLIENPKKKKWIVKVKKNLLTVA